MKKILFSIFLLSFIYIEVSYSAIQEMKIHTYKKNLFKKKSKMTEQKAYEFLSKHPVEKKVNYAAIPWVMLINKKRLKKIKLGKKKLNGGFSVCQHIKYREIISTLRKLGVNILFAPHAPEKQEFKDIIVLPFPIYPTNGVNLATKKIYCIHLLVLGLTQLEKRYFP